MVLPGQIFEFELLFISPFMLGAEGALATNEGGGDTITVRFPLATPTPHELVRLAIL